ncbi:class D sortase [Niallia circulans]|uniref:Class D sortase n=1 Tax=Niallia circulans TaxID=1397 RepID=A0A553SMZ9_NIACI|nr:sortase [Niallia circulans]TRZ38370.1 class D sortase [Niallia circulans]
MKSRSVTLSVCAYTLIVVGMAFVISNSVNLLHANRPLNSVSAYDPKEVISNSAKSTSPQEGDVFGILIAPKQNKEVTIFEGTDSSTLAKGAGHFSGSAYPGESNNTVISGHRDTYFRFLKDVAKNDRIILQTSSGTFTYKIRKTEVVSASAENIVTPKSRPVLTLTTCYPFYFIGDAPERFIVTADLIQKDMSTAR